VLASAIASAWAYDLSARLASPRLHELLAATAGTVSFVSIALGAFGVWLAASLAGATIRCKATAALATPLLWMAQQCAGLLASHPALECLYYAINPLHLAFALLLAIELATATLVERAIRLRRGEKLRVLAPAPIAAVVVSAALLAAALTWGRGENSYVMYLAGYRTLFGSGTEIAPVAPAAKADVSDATRRTSDRAHPPGAGDRRPNIVFILSDNHNAAMTGAAGDQVIRTPALDRLASQGVRFQNAFNTTSLCSPSRASILTGAYAHSHGVLNNHTSWTARMPTFLERLSQAGYASAFLGKWHMPGEGLPQLPFLDLFVSYTYREGQGSYFDCPMIVNGREVPSRKPYITAEITDYAIDFVERMSAEPAATRRPFVVYISHRPGHPPYEAPAPIRGMYDHADVAGVLPPGVDAWWFGKRNYNVFQGVMSGSYYDQYRRYLETLTAMDADIGRLLARIDELGIASNTAVVYMSDNGMQWGSHGVHGIREPYEDCVKLPLLVRAPWLISDAGSVREQIALNIDIAPTLLDLAGAAPLPEADGESLVPILRDARAKGRRAFELEYWRYFPENTPTYRGVRTDRYKYVEFERGRSPWLFDLEADPREMRNLMGTAEGRQLLPELQSMLERLHKGERLD